MGKPYLGPGQSPGFCPTPLRVGVRLGLTTTEARFSLHVVQGSSTTGPTVGVIDYGPDTTCQGGLFEGQFFSARVTRVYYLK